MDSLCHQVMFLQNKSHVTLTIELLDTEEAQADDPLDVQVNTHVQADCSLREPLNRIITKDTHYFILMDLAGKLLLLSFLSVLVKLHGAVCRNRVQPVFSSRGLLLQTCVSAQVKPLFGG